MVYQFNPFSRKLDKLETVSSLTTYFLYKPGISGGQIAYGGNATTESLALYSNTSHDGVINLGDFLEVDEANLGVTIGGTYADTDQDPNIPFSVIKNIDDYSGINVFNRSAGTSAQSNVVVANDSATGYGALGINSTNFSVVDQALYDPGAVFLESGDTNLYVGSGGTTSTTGNTYIYAGGRASKSNVSAVFSYDNKCTIGSSQMPVQDLDLWGHLSFQTINNPSGTPTVVLAGVGAGNVDNGLHNYRFAFVAPTGETALGGTVTGVTVVDKTTNGQVQISDIPQSTDKRVTSIRIYRTKVASSALYYLLATITHGTTTYLDNIADATMGSTLWNFKDNTTGGRIYINGTIGAGRFTIQSTALGYLALNSLTNGRADLALGNSALRFCTEGEFNSAIGTGALENLTTGDSCVAIGLNSLNSNITGSGGLAIGAYASDKATTITGSTVIGFQALYNVATNITGMTVIGYQTGYAPNNVTANACTTSTYCTFLGYKTGLGSTTQRTKSIAIGANAVVDADNTCAIGGTGADAVNVVLGKTTALAKLDIYSSDADGASALGMKLNTSTFWSNIGAKLFSFSNGGNELLYQQASNGNLFVLPISSGGFYVQAYQGTSDATCGIRGVGNAQLDIASNALAGAGTDKDAMIRFYVNEIASPKFVIGVDNSDSDKFKISYGTYLPGTNDRFTITTGGLIGFGTTSPTSTAHVGGSFAASYIEKTADYTLTSSDYTVNCTSGTFTVTLPTAVGIQGRIYNIKNTGTGTITVDANGTETIDGDLTESVYQYENLQIQSTNSNWIIL